MVVTTLTCCVGSAYGQVQEAKLVPADGAHGDEFGTTLDSLPCCGSAAQGPARQNLATQRPQPPAVVPAVGRHFLQVALSR